MPAAPTAPPQPATTPAAKSEPTPTPTTPPTPTPAPTASDKPPLNDAFAELDRMFEAETQKTKPSPEPKKDEPTKQPDQSAKEAAEPKPPEDKPLEDKPKSEGKGGHVASLREAYETSKKRIADLERQLSAPREDPERKAIVEKYESANKRISELERELKESAFERTDEYKREFEQPLVSAFKNAYADVAELEIENEDGTTRKATKDDFDSILRMPLSLAAKSVEKFGASGTVMLQHRQHILMLNNARAERLENARKAFVEKQESSRSMSEKSQAELATRWKSVNDEARSKYPKFFAPEDGDDEGNTILAKGFELADMMFSGRQLTPEEQINLHSAIYNKAGSFDRMVYRMKKKDQRIAELEEALAEFKKSEPSEESVKREEPQKATTWEDELDAIANRSP